MTLDETLYALLFKRAFRRRFLAGERPFAPEVQSALATLDPAELEGAARLACRPLVARSHRGVGTLLDSFPRTIGAYSGDLDELAMEIADTPAFDAFSATPARPGICLEEVFFRFAEERELGVAEERAREFAVALMRGLVVTPRPFFRLPKIVRTAPQGHYVVLPWGPTLVAAIGGRLVTGTITPLLAALLTTERGHDDLGVGPSDAHAARCTLRAMGLLP